MKKDYVVNEEEIKANRYVIKCYIVTLVTVLVVWILNEFRIFINDLTLVRTSISITSVFLLGPILYYKLSKKNTYRTKFILVGTYIIGIVVIATFMTYHTTLVWGIPFLITAHYRTKKMSMGVYLAVVVGVIISILLGYRFGLA